MARKETANQTTARRMSQRPSQADYEALSEFRYLIRCFLQFSQNAARAVGLTPRQHQALLAIKGFPVGHAVTVGDWPNGSESATTAPSNWSTASRKRAWCGASPTRTIKGAFS